MHNSLRAFLLTAILAIVAVTLYATLSAGINFPAVFFGDLLKLDWRSQINTDLMLHAGLLGIWVAWREGATPQGSSLACCVCYWVPSLVSPMCCSPPTGPKEIPKGCSWASMQSQSWVPK